MSLLSKNERLMNEKNNLDDDGLIRQMMQSSKLSAPENLKHRIMHQIESEKALTPKRMKPKRESTSMLKDFRSIFGTMYLLLFGLSVFTVIFGGTEALASTQFILLASLVSVVFASFWGLTRLDVYLREKRKTK